MHYIWNLPPNHSVCIEGHIVESAFVSNSDCWDRLFGYRPIDRHELARFLKRMERNHGISIRRNIEDGRYVIHRPARTRPRHRTNDTGDRDMALESILAPMKERDEIQADRIKELLDVLTDGQGKNWNEFYMRIPAEPDHDADLIIARLKTDRHTLLRLSRWIYHKYECQKWDEYGNNDPKWHCTCGLDYELKRIEEGE